MVDNIKHKTISGMIWTSIGKFGTMGLNFIANLILARLLMPSDYGTIGMLQIFINVSSVFATAGFGMALVQKKNPTHIDYTSVFYWNLIASIIFYFVLFFSGPAISRFYKMPELTSVLRVQSLALIIHAFYVVQSSQLQKQLRFKELSIRTIIATLSGTIVGVVMAFCGYGVWSLVYSHLVSVLVSVLLLWKMSTWRPSWEFSWRSLKELFPFGGLMALSSLVETVYNNIQGLVIGKWFSPSDLGYYTQAKKMETIPTDALSQVVNQVSFPVFSSLQDDKSRLLLGVRKNITSITYINFPVMFLLIVIAKPIVTILYGIKWIESVPYLQILCLAGAIYTMNTINTNVIKSLGKSNIYFIIQLVKRLLGIAFIFISMRWGVFGLMWAITAYSYVALIINSVVNKKLINYGLLDQIKDIGKNIFVTVVSACSTYILSYLPIHEYVIMFLQIMVFCVVFVLLSWFLKLDGFNVYSTIFKQQIGKVLKK